MPHKIKKTFFVVCLTLVICCYAFAFFTNQLSLETAVKNKNYFTTLYVTTSWAPLVYLSTYVIMATLFLPGAFLITTLAGAIFGFWLGTALAILGSSVGALCAFFLSRYLFRAPVTKKYHEQFTVVNEGLRKHGAYYLFSIRIAPIFPYFLVNAVMGITSFSAPRFFFISGLGMLPKVAILANAGTRLGELKDPGDVFSPSLWLALLALASLPLLGVFFTVSRPPAPLND